MRNLQPSSLSRNLNPLPWRHPFSLSGFGLYRCCERRKRGIARNDSHSNRAVDRDSEFEIDPDKAREALRQLDRQLESMSQKQTIPVRQIKAPRLNNARNEVTEDLPDDIESFLPYLGAALLTFTILYNILFITVIKPSVDGPEAELAPVRPSIMSELLKAELEPSVQLPLSPEVSVQQ